MARWRKAIGWTAAAGGILSAALLLLVLLIPYIVNLDWVKKKSLTVVSDLLAADVGYERIDLHLLPLPRATIQGATFHAYGGTQGRISTLTVYPQVGPLFRGDFRIETLRLQNPLVRIRPKARGADSLDVSSTNPIAAATARLTGYFGRLPADGRPTTIEIANGRFVVAPRTDRRLDITAVYGRVKIDTNEMAYRLACRSNAWQSLRAEGIFSPATREGRGRLTAGRLDALRIYDLFPAPANSALQQAILDLDIDFQTRSSGALRAELGGRIPELIISRGSKAISMPVKALGGAVEYRNGVLRLSLSRIAWADSTMALSADATVDRAGTVQITVAAAEVDIAEGKRLTAALIGGTEVYHYINQVLQAGRIPRLNMTVSDQRTSNGHFTGNPKIRLSAHLADGVVHIPGAEITVAGVNGDVEIEDRILSADQLTGRLEGAVGNRGTLVLGLTGPHPSIDLSIEIDTDVAPLPSYLQRWIHQPAVQRELARISGVAGQASGRLMLRGTTASLRPVVDVSGFDLSLTHPLLPYPLQIRGGTSHWNATGMQAENLMVHLNSSRLEWVSLTIGWRTQTPHVSLSSTGAQISVSEFSPWLKAHDRLPSALAGWQPTDGTLNLSRLVCAGFLDSAQDWTYELTGTLDHLQARHPRWPQPLDIQSGSFEVQRSGYPDRQTVFAAEAVRFEGTLHQTVLQGTLNLEGRTGSGNSDFDQIRLTEAALRWNGHPLQLHGTLRQPPGEALPLVDFKLTAPFLDWQTLQGAVSHQLLSAGSERPAGMRPLPLRGKVDARLGALQIGRYSWRPVEAAIELEPESIAIDIHKARMCAIDMPGRLQYSREGWRAAISPVSEHNGLAQALDCLQLADNLATGIYTLAADLETNSLDGRWRDSLRGDLSFSASDGQISRFGLISKILALLDVAGWVRGGLPHVSEKGFVYRKMVGSGRIDHGILQLDEFYIVGQGMDLAFQGEIDLISQTADLDVLVAPFKTLDLLVKYIPVVKTILNNRLVSFPFKVTGPLSDLNVRTLPAAAVGGGLLKVMKKTLQTPFRIIEPLLPDATPAASQKPSPRADSGEDPK